MVGHTNVSIPTPYLLLGVAVLYVAYNITIKLQKNARIRKFGARAPVRQSYLPWGVDLAYDILTHAMNDTIYEMWVGIFAKWARPGQYTIEAGIGERVILTAEPENIKAILATQFKDYGKGEAFRKDWHTFLGNGIFTTDGELWHNSRQLIRPQFIKDRLSDIKIFEEHVQVLISKIEQGQEVDTLDMMFRFTLDAATHFLLGESVDSLQNPQQLFADAFGNAQSVQGMIARVGYVNKPLYLPDSSIWNNLTNIVIVDLTGWFLANAWAFTTPSRQSTAL
jgi:cytochrome P450